MNNVNLLITFVDDTL